MDSLFVKIMVKKFKKKKHLKKHSLPGGLIGAQNHVDLAWEEPAKNRSSRIFPHSCNCKD